MFISNKRAKFPEFVQIDKQKKQSVSKFKLLGVTIDDKLTFDAFVAQQRLSINKRLYMLKRHYYLPHDVKVKFFKAFIMPCFDYCASLSVYFNHTLLEKLSRMYYFCIKSLLKLNLSDLDFDSTSKLLEKYGIQPFQARYTVRILSFLNKICNKESFPKDLKELMKLTTLNNERYSLRSNNKAIVVKNRINNKYGDLQS